MDVEQVIQQIALGKLDARLIHEGHRIGTGNTEWYFGRVPGYEVTVAIMADGASTIWANGKTERSSATKPWFMSWETMYEDSARMKEGQPC